MKAILHTQYGPPDLLQFKEVNKSAPKDNEILISIKNATLKLSSIHVDAAVAAPVISR